MSARRVVSFAIGGCLAMFAFAHRVDVRSLAFRVARFGHALESGVRGFRQQRPRRRAPRDGKALANARRRAQSRVFGSRAGWFR